MSKTETVKMVALMSRPAREGRGALKPGDIYQATAQAARDDLRRGFGALEPKGPAVANSSASGKAGG